MDGFRLLTKDEIECRVGQVSKNESISLLLYKDARVDQKILDERFGLFGWQKRYERDNKGVLFCIVSIKSPDGEWVEKSDVGTESNMESVKGEASDAFKRACFNWGIGRELYTAPQVWIKPTDYKKGGRSTYDKFVVTEIGYNKSGNINRLKIENRSMRKIVFDLSDGQAEESPADELNGQMISKSKIDALRKQMDADKVSEVRLLKHLGIKGLDEMTEEVLSEVVSKWSTEIVPKCGL